MAQSHNEADASCPLQIGRILVIDFAALDSTELIQSVVSLGHSAFGPLSSLEAVHQAASCGRWDAALIRGVVEHDNLKVITDVLAREGIPFVTLSPESGSNCFAGDPHRPHQKWDRRLLSKILTGLLSGARCSPTRTKLIFFEEGLLLRQLFQKWLAEEAPDISVAVSAEPDDLSEVDVAVVHVASQKPLGSWAARVTERLRDAASAPPFAILCDSEEEAHVRWAFSAGARGYLPMSYDRKVILQAIRLIHSGGVFVPSMMLREQDITPSSHDGHDLSPRQREVHTLLQTGKPNKIIAFELGVSEATVKMHVRALMRKLGVTNRTELATLNFCNLNPAKEPAAIFERRLAIVPKSRRTSNPNSFQPSEIGAFGLAG